MNWLIIAYLEGLALLILGIPGLLWLKDWFSRAVLRRDKIIVLRKNGTYDLIKKNTAGISSITVDEKDRKIGAKSIFAGPLGNLIIIPETASEAIRSDKLEIQSDIDPDDLTTIGKLSFFAGQISLMKSKFQEYMPQIMLIVLVVTLLNAIMIFKMQTDFNTITKQMITSLNAIKAALGK